MESKLYGHNRKEKKKPPQASLSQVVLSTVALMLYHLQAAI